MVKRHSILIVESTLRVEWTFNFARGRIPHPTTTPPKKPNHILFTPAPGNYLGHINSLFGLHMVRPTAKLTCATRNVPDKTTGVTWGPVHGPPVHGAQQPTPGPVISDAGAYMLVNSNGILQILSYLDSRGWGKKRRQFGSSSDRWEKRGSTELRP